MEVTVTISDEIADLQREIKMREEVYANQVRAGKLSIKVMQHRLACSRATLARLQALVPQQTGLEL